jgi:hypothetical protein
MAMGRLRAINELFVQAVQNFIKINEQYRESFKVSENATSCIVRFFFVFCEQHHIEKGLLKKISKKN